MPTCQEIHELIQRHCSIDPQSQACIDAIQLCHTKGCMDCPAIAPQAGADQRTEPLTLEQATDNLIMSLSKELIDLQETHQ